jgi:CubicO group peptidase (beta-lactamase class C family)
MSTPVFCWRDPVLVLGVLASLLAGVASAQPPPSAEAARFARETLPALADSFGVPGAVLAVVGPEGPVALAGYGVADVRTGAPADPERTLFRVASVSKPVTATAVLALAERGALDLGADVNGPLRGLRVPDAFGAPVTPHDLLTHTAGLDERIFGGGSPTAAPDLQGYLAATLPDRVDPPGRLHAYSNHGYGLLGALVEDATSRPFPEAMDALVLGPLGMASSTFAQPPPDGLRQRLAAGHACPDGRASCRPLPYDYVAFGPAGALQTTAADLGRFVAFHLAGGDGPLADSARRRMQRAQWRPHPALGGMAYGWHRGLLGRYDVLRHAGGWAGWSAQAVVVPGANVGYAVAVNADDRGLLEALAERFAADVLGGPYAPAPVPDGDLARYEGTYRIARHVHHGADRVAILAGFPMPDLRVVAEGDTALALWAGPSVRRAIPVGDGAFVVPGLDPRRYAFVRDADGRLVLHGDYASLERVPWWATQRSAFGALGAGALVLVATVLAALVRRLRRRDAPPALRHGRVLAALAAGCLLAFALALAGAALTLGPQGLVYGLPAWTRAAFALPFVAGALGLGAAVALAVAVRRREGTAAARAGLAVSVAASLALLPVLAYWGLLGVPGA